MRVGPRRVAQDYFLRFNDAVGQVFSQDVIDRAVAGYVESGGELAL
jgi:hypothetical protein